MSNTNSWPQFVSGLLIVGCGSVTVPEQCDLSSRAIYYGSSVAPIAFASGEPLAIGALQDEAGNTLCSAVMVAPHWALTVAHCEATARLFFAVQINKAQSKPVQVAEVAYTVLQEQTPLALMKLETLALSQALPVRPIGLYEGEPAEGWLGVDVTLAGFGQTEVGTRGQLRFTQTPVVDADDTTIRVDGGGVTGACQGDSGGPLLAEQAGAARVVGVLQSGSRNCLGTDTYVRAWRQASWIEEVTGERVCGSHVTVADR